MNRTGIRPPGGRTGWLPAAVAAGGCLAAGVALVAAAIPEGPPTPSTLRTASTGVTPSGTATPSGTSTRSGTSTPSGVPGAGSVASPSAGAPGRGLPRSVPVLLTIPAIGVRTPLMRLALAPDGTPELPPLGSHVPAGWLEPLASPGETGAAVILGHVDSARDGPAVFYRLGELRPGDRLLVTRADGRVVAFAVTSLLLAPKDRFPGDAVYGRVDYPALRLLTCGGSFDHARGHYRDNLIVFARAEQD